MTQNCLSGCWFERYRAQLFLVLLTLCMVVAIEIKHPFFFLHGDNLQLFLPHFVHNVRSIIGGEVPLFNFHQALGKPQLACIASAAFYPPNYLGVVLSEMIRGDYYLAIEFIAAIHLVITILGFYRFMRFFGLNQWSCCFGAIAWTFCGFVFTVGNSWITQIGYAAYLPWIILYSLRLMKEFSLQNFAILAVLRSTDLYVGNPPYHMYSIAFDFFTVLVLYFVAASRGTEQKVNSSTFPGNVCGFWTFWARQGFNYLCVLMITAPILLPVIHQVRIASADRNIPLTLKGYSANSYNWRDWLNGIFTPFNTSNYSWCDQPYISHIGWLTVFFCIVAFWKRGINRKLVMAFMALALFSFLWASDTFVTRLFYYVPYYNLQRMPFRLAFFTSFFLIIVASFGFDYWSQRVKALSVRGVKIGKGLIALVIVFHIVNFAVFHLSSPVRTFIQHFENVPYEEPLKEMLKDGRMVSIVPAYEMPKRVSFTIQVLGFNYATLFGLYHFSGYETLMSEKNLVASRQLNYSADFEVDKDTPLNPSVTDLEYFRRWGVKWYVVDKKVLVEPSGVLKQVYSDDKRVVLLDAAALPFVYWQDNGTEGAARHSFSTNSISVATERETTGRLVVNVLHNPFFKATVDGNKTEIVETTDMQMLVDVPSGKHTIKITFSDPYYTAGLYILFGFLVIVVIGGVLYRVKAERMENMPAEPLEKEYKSEN